MATVAFYIWRRPSKDGKFPISIRITIDRKPSYIMTGQKLDSLDQWDAKSQRVKKSHPNSARLNNFLLNELAKANDKALEMRTKGHISAQDVKTGIKFVGEPLALFKDVADQYILEQQALGNYECFKTQQGHLKRFYAFAKNKKLTFKDITVEFLRRYIVFLRLQKTARYNEHTEVRPLSERTITNHVMTIRTIYNRAITAKLVNRDDYPFGGEGNIRIKITGSSKIGLEESEIKKLEEIDLSEYSKIYEDARNMWLTEFYFAGMRVTDCLLLKWSDFQNGRLYYQMSKNGEHGSVKVPAKALLIIEKYSNGKNAPENKHGLVFPFLWDLPTLKYRYELRRQISFTVKRLNDAMKEIMKKIDCDKNASQHKARHSFAQRAEEKEIHPKVLQKMYRHESILTTMKYQSNFSFKKADDAIDTVLDF